MNIYFDIETGPLPLNELRASIPPFVPPAEPAPFDEAAVKLGALKDASKIAAKIQAARQKHAESVLDHHAKVKQAEADHAARHLERAALHATTGRVLLVAMRKDGWCDLFISDSDDEAELLGRVWRHFEESYRSGHRFVGFNIFGFDLPFLIRRSWRHGVDVPHWIRNGRYWSDAFVDIMDVWMMGSRQDSISLDNLDKFTGGKGKIGSGADFYRLWQVDRDQAMAYTTDECEILERLARRMGIEEYDRRKLVAAEGSQGGGKAPGGASEESRSYWGA